MRYMMSKSVKRYLEEKIGKPVKLEHPEREEWGDYAFFSRDGKTEIRPDEVVERTERVGNFTNIWLQNRWLISQMERVIEEGNSFGRTSLMQGKKIMVEFTDPNPFKEFHIGHLYSNTVGEAVCRLMEFQGAEVWRVCYQGDVGLHVAKSVWGMKRLNAEMPNSGADLGEGAKFMGKAYALGAGAYEEDENAKGEINDLNKKIYDQDSEVMELWQKGKAWSLEYFERIYGRVGTKFKKYYFESEAGGVGLDLVKKHLQDKVFEESKGAVVFPGEKYGLHTRVFINSLGLPTYEAKELGLAPTKYKDFPYDLSIIITGNEINEYFRVLLKALEVINPDLASKTRHLSHGMVRLPEGKMSSRTGKVVTGEWLLDEAARKIKEMAVDTPEPDKIGKAAVKYAFLRVGVGKDIEFDFSESISFEGNSGPYLQYTYARTQSVLAKYQKTRNKIQTKYNYEYNDEERSILRYLYRFPEIVEEAAVRLAPNLVCNYLYDLASRFNTFYNKHSILRANEAETGSRQFRLLLTVAVGQVIKNGLGLLGIEAPGRM